MTVGQREHEARCNHDFAMTAEDGIACVDCGASPESEDTRLIAVKMSPEAAEALARACGWASHRAADTWEDTSAPGEKRRVAMEQYEWLSWGCTWLTNPEARIEGP